MTTPRKEYLKYLQYLTDNKYDYSEEPETDNTPDNSWIWSEPPAKSKMKSVVFNGIVDAINLRKEHIKEALGKAKNIQVGSFTLHVSSYYGLDPLQENTFSFTVYERKTKTPTGQPCSMDLKADLTKDNRFTGRPWLSYFKGSHARDVPIDTIVDIIRWMQALKKLTAFL